MQQASEYLFCMKAQGNTCAVKLEFHLHWKYFFLHLFHLYSIDHCMVLGNVKECMGAQASPIGMGPEVERDFISHS